MKRLTHPQLLLCIAALFSITLAPSAKAQNLLINGGFEDGFASWTLTPGTFSFAGNDPMFAHTGNGFANLESTGSVASLSQSFSTVVGQMYSISFFLANDVATPPFSFTASFGPASGTPQYTLTNTGTFNYTQISFNAVATSTTSTIQFNFQHDADFFRLDTVSVIPEPSTNALMMLSAVGLLGVVQYRRAKARRLSAQA